MDLSTFEDHTLLVVVHVTPRFPVLRILTKETSNSVLNSLKGIYCDFGLPKKVITDNGPCFKSSEFRDFHAEPGITTKTSSTYNHVSTGLVECMVQTIKQIMVKTPKNTWLTMLIFRAIPIPGVFKSPAELLNSCKYRTSLPMYDFNHQNESEVDKLIEARK